MQLVKNTWIFAKILNCVSVSQPLYFFQLRFNHHCRLNSATFSLCYWLSGFATGANPHTNTHAYIYQHMKQHPQEIESWSNPHVCVGYAMPVGPAGKHQSNFQCHAPTKIHTSIWFIRTHLKGQYISCYAYIVYTNICGWLLWLCVCSMLKSSPWTMNYNNTNLVCQHFPCILTLSTSVSRNAHRLRVWPTNHTTGSEPKWCSRVFFPQSLASSSQHQTFIELNKNLIALCFKTFRGFRWFYCYYLFYWKMFTFNTRLILIFDSTCPCCLVFKPQEQLKIKNYHNAERINKYLNRWIRCIVFIYSFECRVVSFWLFFSFLTTRRIHLRWDGQRLWFPFIAWYSTL